MGLNHSEYRALLDLVGEVHDAASMDDLRASLLPTLRRMVRAEYASYNEVGPGASMVAIADPQLPEWAYAAWARHSEQNPLVARHVRTRDSRPYQWSDVVGASEFRRTALFRELYKPLGIDHQIAFTLPSPAELTIGVALSRAGRAYSESEREMLDLARPHIIQAYRNAQVRDELAGLLDEVSRGVDASGQGVAVLTADDTVSFASARAVALVERAGAGALREGQPPPAGLVTSARTTMLSVEGGDSVLVRRVDGLQAGSTVLILEAAKRAVSIDVLRSLGLTPREAEVLAGLAQGTDSAEVAAELGVSGRTLQKHVQAIHAKLGVRSRAQAVATAWAAGGAVAASRADRAEDVREEETVRSRQAG